MIYMLLWSVICHVRRRYFMLWYMRESVLFCILTSVFAGGECVAACVCNHYVVSVMMCSELWILFVGVFRVNCIHVWGYWLRYVLFAWSWFGGQLLAAYWPSFGSTSCLMSMLGCRCLGTCSSPPVHGVTMSDDASGSECILRPFTPTASAVPACVLNFLWDYLTLSSLWCLVRGLVGHFSTYECSWYVRTRVWLVTIGAACWFIGKYEDLSCHDVNELCMCTVWHMRTVSCETGMVARLVLRGGGCTITREPRTHSIGTWRLASASGRFIFSPPSFPLPDIGTWHTW
jgi:hypothetical protein